MDIEKLKVHLESPEGKKQMEEWFEKRQIEKEIKQKRFVRFDEWLKHNDFDKLIQRLILEHGEDYRDKCYHKGYEPHPNQKLGFVIDYVQDKLEQIRVSQLENMFNTQIWFFKGYYFRIMHGQGSVFDLYNGSDFKHLLSA